MFISPTKITRAFKLQQEREEAQQAEITRKQERAVEKALKKQWKEQEKEERRIERERKKLER